MKTMEPGRAISIVDDDESVRRSLTGPPRSVGYEVTVRLDAVNAALAE
jgi:FixJ family two-component response regulator